MRRTSRGRAETLIALLSLLVVVSMILGTVLSVLPARERQAQSASSGGQLPPPTVTRVLATLTLDESAATPTYTPAMPPTPLPQPTR